MKNRTCLVLIASFLFACGCSSLVAISGKDVSQLASMDEVHREFGKPVATGVADSQDYEEFVTHSKIADPQRAGVLALGDLMTSGLMEFFLFPYQMAELGYTTVAGDKIRFCYDSQGNVTGVFLGGEQIALRTNVNRLIDGPKASNP
jgi:YD repeat-containing protein